MNKYEKMLECNRKASDEKIERARKAIFELMDEGEKVTVPKLMEKTGLSRGFFYKNPSVRQTLDRVEMDALRQENEKLKKALDRKNRELLRNL